MTTKDTSSAHIRLGGLKVWAKKRCARLNKANKDVEQKWDLSKYVRWLIRRDMKGEMGEPQWNHAEATAEPQLRHNVVQSDQVETTDYYDSLLNLTRR